jgi:hypothetical protein
MSNTQSKQSNQNNQMLYEQCDAQEGCTFLKDKLILKLEEVSKTTGDVIMKCFVAYDHNESEYFVCGKSQIADEFDSRVPEDFNFYCKSRKNLTLFLRYTLSDEACTADTTLNHVLYNYKDLEEQDYVDYWMLEDQEDSNSEISGFNDATFSRSWLTPLLKTLKYVRY